ncbi:MAG: AMP-binding protein [Candidatus Dormibacteraeota bacterium]|nr:AMP-binding protein [Candidatus Dormibacteraeota bacterium]
MSDSRQAWLEMLDRHLCHLDAPGDDRWWCPEYDRIEPERLHALHSEKLPLAVRYLYDNSPLYRRKFQEAGLDPASIRSVDDLTRLPIVTKEDMSRHGGYLAVDEAYWDRHGWMLFQTSGTTAAPRVFRYTNVDRRFWTWTDARALWAMGIRPGDRALLCFGYGPHVAMWGMLQGLNQMSVPVIPSGGMDSKARASLVVNHRPTVLAATPSFALFLAGLVREMGVDPRQTAVRRLISLGEPLPAATRGRIEESWDADVHQFYGCTEAAPSCGGYTCGHAMHVMEDTHLIETVDPVTMKPVPDGEPGLSVITNLCSEASPQLRFLVGDFTALSRGTCECGRTHVRTSGFAGRADDMLNVRGVTVFPSAVEDLMRGLPEVGDEFQIVLERPSEGAEVLRLLVEPRGDASAGGLADRIAVEFRVRFDLRADIEVVPPGSLPKTEFKAKRVRDLRE